MSEPERPDVEREGAEDHALDRLRQFEHERGFEESDVGPEEPADEEPAQDEPAEEEAEDEAGGEADEEEGGMPEP